MSLQPNSFLTRVRESLLPLLLLSLFLPVRGLQAETSPDLQQLLIQIEQRRFSWQSYTSGVNLSFKTEFGQTAACSGTLDYQRLHERLLLMCYSAPGKLAFILKTDDEEFELYLPSHAAVYEGNIFDLEFSEDINTHIQPMDLYRALKTMPVFPDTARIETVRPDSAVILIKEDDRDGRYDGRRLITDFEGNVSEETYMDKEGDSYLKISRGNFKKVKIRGYGRPMILPRQIVIKNLRQKTETSISFVDIQPAETDKDWELRLPEDTRRIRIPPMENAG